MIRSSGTLTALILVVALALCTLPAGMARAESGSSSIGAGITIGLMFSIVVVYGLVSLRSDIERFSEAEHEDALMRAARLAEESPIVLQAVTKPIGSGSGPAGGEELAGVAVGWRITF